MTATSSTTWPAGSWNWTGARGSPGRATTPPGWSRSRTDLQQEEKSESERQKTLQRELEWIRMSPKGRHAKGQGPHHLLRAAPVPRRAEKQRERSGDLHPARTAAGQHGHRGREREQGLRRQPADRGDDLPPPARRHRRHHRPERRRQDDPLPDDHRPGDSPTPAPSASARR